MNEDKIKILFKQLNLSQEEQDKYKDLSLDKVKVNEKLGSWTFVLKANSILPLTDYVFLSEGCRKAFQDIKIVNICILPINKTNDYFNDYYSYALNNCKDILVFAPIFKDSLIAFLKLR